MLETAFELLQHHAAIDTVCLGESDETFLELLDRVARKSSTHGLAGAIVRSGSAIEETFKLVEELGAKVIGVGAIVHFASAPREVQGIKVKSLVEFDAKMYDTGDECAECIENAPEEHVRF